MIKLKINHHIHNVYGQALVVVLVLVVVSTTLFTASTISVLSASEGALFQTLSQEALSIAESGANEAIYRLLRDPSYSGSTISIGNTQCVIAVSSPTPPIVTITSVGRSSNVSKTVTLVGSLQKGKFTRQSITIQ